GRRSDAGAAGRLYRRRALRVGLPFGGDSHAESPVSRGSCYLRTNPSLTGATVVGIMNGPMLDHLPDAMCPFGLSPAMTWVRNCGNLTCGSIANPAGLCTLS